MSDESLIAYIEKLEAALAAERERNAEIDGGLVDLLERQNAKLREALEPFSKECDRLGAQFVTPETVMRPTIEAGELSRARAVLAETKEMRG